MHFYKVIITALSTLVATTHAENKRVSPCACIIGGLLYNLQSLASESGPRFSVNYSGWTYSYNPCIPYKIPGCQQEFAVSKTAILTKDCVDIGSQAGMKCVTPGGFNTFKYTWPEAASYHTYIQLTCDHKRKKPEDAQFTMWQDNASPTLIVKHLCACGNACPLTTPASTVTTTPSGHVTTTTAHVTTPSTHVTTSNATTADPPITDYTPYIEAGAIGGAFLLIMLFLLLSVFLWRRWRRRRLRRPLAADPHRVNYGAVAGADPVFADPEARNNPAEVPPGEGGREEPPLGEGGAAQGPQEGGGAAEAPPGEGGAVPAVAPPERDGVPVALPGERGAAQAPPGEVGPAEAPPGEGGAEHAPPGEGGAGEALPREGGAAQGPQDGGGAEQAPPGEAGPAEAPPGEGGAGQALPREGGAEVVSLGEGGPEEAQPGEGGAEGGRDEEDDRAGPGAEGRAGTPFIGPANPNVPEVRVKTPVQASGPHHEGAHCNSVEQPPVEQPPFSFRNLFLPRQEREGEEMSSDCAA